MEICSCLIEREKKTERTILLYCLPLRRFSFADTAEAFPRLNEPRASCRHVDHADRRKFAGEKNERERKRGRKSHAQSCHVLLKIHQRWNIVWRRPGRPDISSCRGNRTSIDALDASWERAFTNTKPLFYCPTTRLIYSGDNSAPRKRYFWPRWSPYVFPLCVSSRRPRLEEMRSFIPDQRGRAR